MGFADSEIGPQARFKKCLNMYHTFLKSSNLALFRTVFRFEKFQLEIYFLIFQSSKIRKKFAKSYNNVFEWPLIRCCYLKPNNYFMELIIIS